MRTRILTALLLLAFAASIGSARASTRVTGSVVDDATGAPLPDAHVVVFALSMGKDRVVGQPAPWTRLDVRPDADGRFDATLETPWPGPGKAYIIATAIGHTYIRPALAPSTDEAGWQFKPVYDIEHPLVLPLRLKRGPTLAGVVTDEGGRPVAGARIGLTLSGPNWCSWPQAFSIGSGGEGHWPPDTVTDAHGRWEMLSFPIEELSSEFGHHKDGQFVVTIEHDRFAPVIVAAVERRPQKDDVIEITSVMRAGAALDGRVLDTAGKPVAGATVTLSGVPRATDPQCHEFTKKVVSGTDAKFAAQGLDDREWSVIANAAGFGPSEPVKVRGGARTPLELRLTPGGEVKGRLRDENGKALANVTVYLSGPSRRFETGTTGSDGTFCFSQLPLGTFTVGAYNMFERKAEVPGAFLDVALEARRPVLVKLVSQEDGKPIRPPATVHFRAPQSSWPVPLTRDDGTIDAGLLYPGIYTIHADVPGRASAGVRLNLTGGTKEAARPTIEVPLGFTLRGQVRGRDGKPIKGATVSATATIDDEREAATDDKGVYELKGLKNSYFVVGSNYVLTARADGFAPWDDVEVFLRLGADRRLDITLDRGATVRGRVVSADGKPAERVEVRVSGARKFLMASYYAPASMPSALTGVDGRYVLEHVPVGEVTLVSGSASKTVKTEDGEDLTVDWTQ